MNFIYVIYELNSNLSLRHLKTANLRTNRIGWQSVHIIIITTKQDRGRERKKKR